MLRAIKLNKESADRTVTEKLYLTAFPEIERHPVEELWDACCTGKCEWLIFKDEMTFVGMAYMIVNEGIAFLLYLAVDDTIRNNGYGSKILKELITMYEGSDIILLIESLKEPCDNPEIRFRRRNFYLRNHFYDTMYIQSTLNGAAIYDILSSRRDFDCERWKKFIEEYPMPSYMDHIYQGDNFDLVV